MTTSDPAATTTARVHGEVTTGGVYCARCGISTPIGCAHYCPNTPGGTLTNAPSRPQQGWQCPVCGKVYAPWVYSCGSDHTTPATGANR